MRFYQYVYFIKPRGLHGPVKIGATIDVTKRLGQLSKASPIPLEVIAVVSGGLGLERSLHAYFQKCHSHGEWFRLTGEMETLIWRLNEGEDVYEVLDLSTVKRLRSGVLGRDKLEMAS